MSRLLLSTFLLLAGTPGHGQGNCEAIRAQVEAKIRASGVAAFSLKVADADARLEGRVVGRCDLGRKKIVYVATSASSPAAADDRILTECKDGTVTYGRCKP